MAKKNLQSIPVGQNLLTVTGNQRGAAADLNPKTIYRDAVGFINQVGQWRLMEQTNSSVAIGNRSLLGVLQGASWKIEAHPDANERVVEATREALFERMDRRFESVIKTFLRAPGFGFAPHEITTHIADGVTWFKDFAYRPPNTIEIDTVRLGADGWYECSQKYFDSNNMLKTVHYGQPGDEGKGWLLWVAFGDNGTPFGEAFYRPIWPIHRRREIAMQLEPLALQKAALGVPVVFLREGFDPNIPGGPVSKEDYEQTLEEIGDVTSHEQGVVGIPSWVDRIEEFYGQSDALETLAAVIDKSDIQIMTYFAAQYAARGTITAHGTNSANESDQAAQGGHRAYFMDWISEQFQQAIDWFVDYNFGPQRYYPTLKGFHDQEFSPAMLLQNMIAASTANLLNVDQPVRDQVRTLLALEIEEMEPEQDQDNGSDDGGTAGDDQGDNEPGGDGNADPDSSRDRNVGADFSACAESSDCNCGGGCHYFNAPIMQAEVDPAAEPQAGIKVQPKRGGQDQKTGPNGRPLSKLEKLCNFRKMQFTFDNGEQALTGLLMDARRDFGQYVVNNVGDDWTTPAELAEQAQKVKIPKGMIARVARQVKAELDNVARQATDAVDSEHAKQKDSVEFQSDEFGDDDPLRRVEANRAANEAAADAINQIVTASVSIIAPDLTKDQIFDLWQRSIDEFSAAQATATATQATGNTFARARQARVDQITESGDPPARIWYSAVMDKSTCTECELADGRHGEDGGDPIEPGSAEHVYYMPPFQRCLGGVRCRCILVYDWS